MSTARHLFADEKLPSAFKTNPEDTATDGSVSPIKNSNFGNRMAGAIKEGPGTMGSVAALWFLSGRAERNSAGEIRGQEKSAFI
jgi:hypothetical protein